MSAEWTTREAQEWLVGAGLVDCDGYEPDDRADLTERGQVVLDILLGLRLGELGADFGGTGRIVVAVVRDEPPGPRKPSPGEI